MNLIWKCTIILIVICLSVLCVLPTFYGESPSIQISSAKIAVNIDSPFVKKVENILLNANIPVVHIRYIQNQKTYTTGTIHIRFSNIDQQLQARDLLENALNSTNTEKYIYCSLSITE